MVLLNTSFHIDPRIEKDLVEWVRRVYAPALAAHGGLGAPIFAKVDVPVGEEVVSYCFQMTAPDREKAFEWHDSKAAQSLRSDLHRRFGEQLVHFTTCMDIIPLND